MKKVLKAIYRILVLIGFLMLLAVVPKMSMLWRLVPVDASLTEVFIHQMLTSPMSGNGVGLCVRYTYKFESRTFTGNKFESLGSRGTRGMPGCYFFDEHREDTAQLVLNDIQLAARTGAFKVFIDPLHPDVSFYRPVFLPRLELIVYGLVAFSMFVFFVRCIWTLSLAVHKSFRRVL
jgi:hypothetical protein